ncbi:hypothetical protein TSUD_403700 [Trifolium subterraneum]|uniref:Protein kinase domain-containing protein n=1 Tax=Trifolium subterraneum TaxID=3900 RepID=A0A2Z6PNN1_TRISU|nr:hypothetical protein TSUD_403700 [Trifolium subterraneum]
MEEVETLNPNIQGSGEYETSRSSGIGSATGLTGIMVAKSTELSYQELAKATNNFNLDHKIGQGGFGAVYYAELRGEWYSVCCRVRLTFVVDDETGFALFKGFDHGMVNIAAPMSSFHFDRAFSAIIGKSNMFIIVRKRIVNEEKEKSLSNFGPCTTTISHLGDEYLKSAYGQSLDKDGASISCPKRTRV